MEKGIFGDFTAKLASKIVSKLVKKKFGYDAEINIKSFGSVDEGEDVYFCVDADARIKKSDLEALLKDLLGVNQ